MNLLAEEGSRIGSMLVEVQEKMREFHLNKDLLEGHVESTCDDTECRDVHISVISMPALELRILLDLHMPLEDFLIPRMPSPRHCKERFLHCCFCHNRKKGICWWRM
ncbi:hypothetical protein QJS10_CPA02g00412 [Acorus calamus]|uniref:Uncharacterized protein n=1 Tax=Acorus calamus TaxID=4465 RepID=A0AAV9FER1_ACOCL|nr:hypothetical protein QJS10_CPA02g00412 [Acorus calamus]